MSPNGAVGIAASRFAGRSGRLMDLVDDLRAACGTTINLNLPRIVVIGNQSAGKSSLVEAISGITVPRDDGTCTRCPMEVRLRHSKTGEWRCSVFVRFETDATGKPVNPPREIAFGPSLTNKARVEGTLRRAQLAVLNPSVININAFVNMNDKEVTDAKRPDETAVLPLGSTEQLPFTVNPVVVDIEGPELTDLTFLDLPGLISNADNHDVDLIRNLVVNSIQGNCLILLTLTMREDIENQMAEKLAKQADPEGRRTIGVLTKPDTLQAGEATKWVDIVEGRRRVLHLGYYVTKQPGIEDLRKNLSHAAARQAERDYFSSAQPLPTIRQTIHEEIEQNQKLLDSIPDPPSNHPVGDILTLVANFTRDIDAITAGAEKSEKLVQIKNVVSETFARNVRATRPRLRPFPRSDFSTSTLARSLEELSPLPRKKAADVGPVEAADDDDDERSGGEDGPQETNRPTKPLPKRVQSRNSPLVDRWLKTCTEEKSSVPVVTMNLTDARAHIAQRKSREQPLNVPYSAKNTLMIEATSGWLTLTLDALEAMRNPVLESVLTHVKSHFGFKAELHRISDDLVRDQITILFADCKTRLQDLLDLESVPYTQNNHYYQATFEKTLAEFKQIRKSPTGSRDPEALKILLAALAGYGFSKMGEEDLSKLLPDDEYATELDLFAHVIASWKVAYKRLIDNVPRIIDATIIRKLHTMSSVLIQGITAGGEEKAARLLAEPAELKRKRANGLKAREQLEESRRLLSAFDA